MLFAADIGNSTTSIGLIKGNNVIYAYKSETDKKLTALNCEEMIKNFIRSSKIRRKDVNSCIVSSVVPKTDKIFKKTITDFFKFSPLFVSSNLNLGIKVKVKTPEEVGSDRLVNACAAHSTIQKDIIVIDFGTATTFDYVTKNGDFLGGVIAPGIGITAKALYENTSKLKDVSAAKTKTVIGKDTESAIKSGLYIGYIGLVEKIVASMKEETGKDVKVIATGGAFNAIKDDLNLIDIYDEHLIFKGLNIISSLNK